MFEIGFSENKEVVLNKVTILNKEWEVDIANFINEWFNDSTYIRAETSGSTGVPKRVKLDKEKVINSALATGNFFNFKEEQNALLCISPKFIAGKLMIVRAIVWKLHLICVEPTSNPLKYLSKNTVVDFVAMVPMQLKNSVPQLLSSNVKTLVVGGGPVDESLLDEIKILKTEVYSSYGMTETITHIALKKLNGKDVNDKFTALYGVHLSTDNRNCLVISAKNISETDVVTNDIVELVNNKEFRWLGRFDNIINSGGVKINPENIEQILSSYISKPFFISSLKDDSLGEKLILIVEGKNNNFDLNYMRLLLPKYHSPKEIYYLREFVRTSSGKINRRKTIEMIR